MSIKIFSFTRNKYMSDKTVLITGANKGIGYEISRQLGELDYRVFLTARDKNLGKEAEEKLRKQNLDVEFVQLDVISSESIKSAFKNIKKKCSQLDLLINNAAILLDKADILKMSIPLLQKTIDTNVYGVIEVIRRFLPMMGKGGRIINISSDQGSLARMGTYAPAYSISKVMVNAVTRQFANTLVNQGIAVNSMHPGWVRTDMGGRTAPLSLEQGAETAVWLATEAPHSFTGKFFSEKKEMEW
jgi:NAD(P)-dependent dehydrogenase (short-subunit alcohol dehydrogenase family)